MKTRHLSFRKYLSGLSQALPFFLIPVLVTGMVLVHPAYCHLSFYRSTPFSGLLERKKEPVSPCGSTKNQTCIRPECLSSHCLECATGENTTGSCCQTGQCVPLKKKELLPRSDPQHDCLLHEHMDPFGKKEAILILTPKEGIFLYSPPPYLSSGAVFHLLICFIRVKRFENDSHVLGIDPEDIGFRKDRNEKHFPIPPFIGLNRMIVLFYDTDSGGTLI